METFTEVQIWLIGMASTVIVSALAYYVKKTGQKFNRKTATIAIMLLALILTFAFSLPAFPPFPEIADFSEVAPPEYVAAIVDAVVVTLTWLLGSVAVLAAPLGTATFIYNMILADVADKRGWGSAQFKRKARSPQVE